MSLVTPRKGYKSVPWLFGKEIEIPQEWEVKKFHKICSVPNGQVDPKKQPFCDMKHIGQKNIEKNNGVLLECFTAKEEGQISGKYLFNEKHILYGKINPNFAKVAFPKFSGICSADMYPIDCKEGEVIAKFLFYCLLSTGFIHYAISVSDRTGIPKINRNELNNSKFIMPCIKEQQKIANILSNVDNLIKSTVQVIENSKSLQKGLMQKLLIHGIDHTKFKKVPWLFGKMIEIPEEWEVQKINELAKVNSEQINNDFKYDKIEYVDISSIEQFQITKLDKYSTSERPSRAQRIIKNKDIIISTVRPYMKSFCLVHFDKPNLICSTGFTVVRAKINYDINFLFNYFKSYLFESNYFRKMEGMAYPAITSSVVSNSLIPTPKDEKEREKIAIILSNIDSKIKSQEKYKKKLQLLKKSLMQKLLTGEVRVKL